MIRERVIRIHYEEEALDFISDYHIRAFHQMLGRAISYGIRSKTNEGLEFFDISLNAAGEIACAAFPSVPWSDCDEAQRTPFYALSTAFDAFRAEQPAMIYVSPQEDGTYLFHQENP